MQFLFETHLIIIGTTPEMNFLGHSRIKNCFYMDSPLKRSLNRTYCTTPEDPFGGTFWREQFLFETHFIIRVAAAAGFCTHVCASRPHISMVWDGMVPRSLIFLWYGASRPVENIKRPFLTRLHICRFLFSSLAFCVLCSQI